jgi:hypothetical protein
MSVKSKTIIVMAAHPKLVTFVIGFGIIMVAETAIGMFEVQRAHALNFLGSVIGKCSGC